MTLPLTKRLRRAAARVLRGVEFIAGCVVLSFAWVLVTASLVAFFVLGLPILVLTGVALIPLAVAMLAVALAGVAVAWIGKLEASTK